MAKGTPLHEEVSSWIRSRIESGELAQDDQLPSESSLGSRFDVSRITVRRALQTLETEGLIYRRQGLGSFVRDARVHQGLVRLTDFVEDMTAAGLRPASRVTAFEQESAGGRISSVLGLEEGSPVMRLDRLRLAEDDPIAFDRTWMPVFYSHLLEGHDLEKDSIYRIFERHYGIQVDRGHFRIEAVNAPNDVARLLNVPWGRALLMIERTSVTDAGKCFYFQQRFYRSDRVAYELELKRSGSTSSQSLPLTEFEPVFRLGEQGV